MRIEQPGSCLAEGQSCAESTQLDQQDSMTYTCDEGADGSCSCVWDFLTNESLTDEGSWGTAGGELYLDDADGSPYCVGEDGLWLSLEPAGLLPFNVLLSPQGAG